MTTHIDDELRIMDEREKESPAIKTGVTLDDPLEAIGLREPITVSSDTSLLDAFKLMAYHDIGSLLVTDKKGKLKGIITERDVVRKACAHCEIIAKDHVGEFMSTEPRTLQSDDSVAFALNRMCVHNIRHVPIIDKKNKVEGVVSMRDIVKHVGDCYQKEIVNLPPRPVRRMRNRFNG
jgi:CBS domain-containing protein